MVAAIAVLGPALAPGPLLNLDLVVPPRFQVPPGIWGLGPEFPRRVPYWLTLAWTSQVLGGPVAVKLLLAIAIAASFVGAVRLVGAASVATRVGAGAVYALSPFLLTRVSIGHVGVVLAHAVLPWVLPVLLRPNARPARTFLAALALGLTGYAGGALAIAAVAVGVLGDRGRGAVRAAAITLVAQLPWLVPGVIVALSGLDVTDSTAFPTRAAGLVGWLGLPAGHGFWRQSSQVGGRTGAGVALLGAVLLGLAVAGAGQLAPAWRRRATALAIVGLTLALASAVPGVRVLYAAVTSTALGAAGREGQRWIDLFLVWMAPAAALGATRLGGRAIAATPLACALALAAPGLWGANGRLEPVTYPTALAEAKAQIDRRPGPVLGLPWHQYFDLSFARGRRVLNPLPDYLGGDVIVSSNPELGGGRREGSDPREPTVDRILARADRGTRPAPALARLGVRWVVLLREADWRRHAALAADPGLERVVASGSVELFRVRRWRGPVVDRHGQGVQLGAGIAPARGLASSGRAVWQHAHQYGWRRGWTASRKTTNGTVALPAGRGVLWFWPSVVVALAYLCTLCACLRAWSALRSERTLGTVRTTAYTQADGTT